jgi:hypothetical protein
LPDALADKVDLPAWTANYRTDREQDAWTLIDDRQKKISLLQAEIAGEQQKVLAEQWLKMLLSATGSDLQRAVARALEELGFRVAVLDGNRTDILARDGDTLLAIEVKGPDNRVARSEDVGQANRWLGDLSTALVSSDESIAADTDLAELDAAMRQLDITRSDTSPFRPKAVLVLEPTRLTPLAERTQGAFAPNIIADLERTRVCGLTGTQLLGLVLESRNPGCDKAELRKRFFDTVGQMATADWRKFLHVAKTDAVEK